MEIDKSKLLDTMGRPLTQGLFLEIGYNTKYAIYTLNDEDKEYEGKTYPSLKRLFLECEDPTEYTFAKTYLLNWNHWQRLNQNSILRPEFEEWREELEVLIRSDAVRSIRDMTVDGNNFQAAKFLADRGWDKRGAGRPPKSEVEKENRIKKRVGEQLEADVVRMEDFK